MEFNIYSDAESFYPDVAELADWIEGIHAEVGKLPFSAEVVPDFFWQGSCGCFHAPLQLMKFNNGKHDFWGAWQFKPSGSPAPLLVQLPGYGAELSCHTDVAAEGYNLLNLSPLGYWTPKGFNTSLLRDGNWPVLPDTIRTNAKGGYREWLLDCVCAIRWAMSQSCVIPGAVSFYGTSQGGGGALLLGSLFAGRGTKCVAADEPFLTNYPLAAFRGAYGVALPAFDADDNKKKVWHSLGFADTITHAKRMVYPVLLTSGGRDDVCPPETVASLFERLPQTRSLTHLHSHGHGYNREFIKLACAWFSIYS